MKALVVGPGRIGCGFAGEVLRSAGYELVVVARDPAMAAHLNRVGRYHVRMGHGGLARETAVDGVRAVPASSTEAVAREVATCDLAAVAVGARNLPAVADLIAPGLAARDRPVNVLVFENEPDAGGRLRALMAERVRPPASVERHGYAGVVVTRAMTGRLGSPASDRPLTFVGDFASRFAVERRGLRADLRPLPGMTVTDDFEASMHRKLFVFSAGHAATAYLGHLKGYRFVHTAIRDPEIRAVVHAAMREGQRGLAARYGTDAAGDRVELEAIVARFENASLADPVCRVARDPSRKLAATDRLVGAARLAEAAGVRAHSLAFVIAAALSFHAEGDPSAEQVESAMRRGSVLGTLIRLSGLDPLEPLGHRVGFAWSRIARSRYHENFLLSLRNGSWAWEPAPEATAPVARPADTRLETPA